MEATPRTNRSAKGGARSSLRYGGEGVLIHPPHQGVGGRHGTEEQCVTSGGLTGSPGGTGVSGPISTSEMASDAAVSSRTFAIAFQSRRVPRKTVAYRQACGTHFAIGSHAHTKALIAQRSGDGSGRVPGS